MSEHEEARRLVAVLKAHAEVGRGVLTEEEVLVLRRALDSRADLLAALVAVVAVADRKTAEFDAAHAAIAKARVSP